MQASPLLSLSPSSPSFNSYSSVHLADIAARVVEEFRLQDSGSELEADEWGARILPFQQDENDGVQDDEFEFALVSRETDSSSISADEIFFNGQIRPTYNYPLFASDLVPVDSDTAAFTAAAKAKSSPSARSPLRKLLSEEREPSSSSSSSEADELDGVSPDSYCVWTPKRDHSDDSNQESSPGKCKKSNSTGSSKRWKLRDLLLRSNSDGKDTFVFLTPNKKNERTKEEEEKAATEKPKPSMKEHYYHVKSFKTVKEGEKRRSFLPYRQDVVGLFSNVNGLSRNLHPF